MITLSELNNTEDVMMVNVIIKLLYLLYVRIKELVIKV
jgi:hypothetical protein